MEGALDFLKKYPLQIGISVLGLIGIFIYVRKSGSTASGSGGAVSVQYGDPQSAAIGAQTSLQSQNISSQLTAALAAIQGDVAKTSMQKDVALAENDTQKQFYGYQFELGKDTLSVQQHISDAQISASKEMLFNTNASTLAATLDTNATGLAIATLETARDNHVSDNQVSMNATTVAGAVTINGQNTTAAVTINGQNTTAAQNIASINAERDKNINYYSQVYQTYRTQLETGAAVAINGQNTAAATTINEQNTNAAVAIVNSNNGRDVSLAGIQAGTINHYVDAQLAAILADLNNANEYDARHTAVAQTIVNQMGSGVYNKGGEGGANQTSILAAIFGQPSVGVAAQGYLASNAASFWGAIASIFKTAGAVATAA